MTQSDVERALPGADRALLDSLFIRAYGERFAAGAPDAPTDAEGTDGGDSGSPSASSSASPGHLRRRGAPGTAALRC